MNDLTFLEAEVMWRDLTGSWPPLTAYWRSTISATWPECCEYNLWKQTNFLEGAMPRGSKPADRSKNLEELYPAAAAIGNAVITALELGAYVGMWHNYQFGINVSLMYEDSKERFYALTAEEVQELPKEFREWVDELKQAKSAKKRTGGQKPS